MSGQIFLNACNNKLLIALVMLSFCWSCNNGGCLAQDDFQDTAGADTGGNDATSDMLDTDPNTLNPQKNQMSGIDISSPSDIPESKKAKGGKDKKDKGLERKSIADQTVQACLQFGVLVGVALLVGILFMLNVWSDMLYTSLRDKFTEKFSVHKPVDIEDQDPASLVGTFQRYK